MAKRIAIFQKSMPFITVGLLFATLIFIIQGFKEGISQDFSLAITIDLLITIPLLYLLMIRKGAVPKITVVPIIVLGFIMGSLLLPTDNQHYLNLFKSWVLPILELTVICIVIFKSFQVIKGFKKEKDQNPDFYEAIKKVSFQTFPKSVASIFAAEIAMIYYGFLHWKSLKLSSNDFTYHKNSGAPAILGAIILIIAVETYVLHMMIIKWNVVIAWVVTGLSIYTLIQFYAFAKSLSKRPVTVTDNSILLRYGLMAEAEIKISNIKHIELNSSSLPKEDGFKKLSFLGELDQHNVVLSVKKKDCFYGIYGIHRKFKTLGFFIDEPERFKKLIEEKTSLRNE